MSPEASCVRAVTVRKQLSDIAERERAKQRVHHCVRQNVRVRVPLKTLFKWNLHAA